MDQGYCEKAWLLKGRWPATTLPGLSRVNTEYVLVNRLFDVPAAQAKADAPIHMYLRRILGGWIAARSQEPRVHNGGGGSPIVVPVSSRPAGGDLPMQGRNAVTHEWNYDVERQLGSHCNRSGDWDWQSTYRSFTNPYVQQQQLTRRWIWHVRGTYMYIYLLPFDQSPRGFWSARKSVLRLAWQQVSYC